MVSCKEYSLQDGWLAAMNCSSKEAERHRSQQAFAVFRTPEVDKNIDFINQKSIKVRPFGFFSEMVTAGSELQL